MNGHNPMVPYYRGRLVLMESRQQNRAADVTCFCGRPLEPLSASVIR